MYIIALTITIAVALLVRWILTGRWSLPPASKEWDEDRIHD